MASGGLKNHILKLRINDHDPIEEGTECKIYARKTKESPPKELFRIHEIGAFGGGVVVVIEKLRIAPKYNQGVLSSGKSEKQLL